MSTGQAVLAGNAARNPNASSTGGTGGAADPNAPRGTPGGPVGSEPSSRRTSQRSSTPVPRGRSGGGGNTATGGEAFPSAQFGSGVSGGTAAAVAQTVGGIIQGRALADQAQFLKADEQLVQAEGAALIASLNAQAQRDTETFAAGFGASGFAVGGPTEQAIRGKIASDALVSAGVIRRQTRVRKLAVRLQRKQVKLKARLTPVTSTIAGATQGVAAWTGGVY